jgi:DNA-binding response OmpR family regulator
VRTANDLFEALGLLNRPSRVLVVEDHLGWLFALSTFLESKGHTVIKMVGVLEVNSKFIEGLGENGNKLEPSPEISSIDAVFLDYNFAGRKHNGASFLREFRLHSTAPVMGMSSDRGCNEVLDALGATVTMQKGRLRNLLFEDR